MKVSLLLISQQLSLTLQAAGKPSTEYIATPTTNIDIIAVLIANIVVAQVVNCDSNLSKLCFYTVVKLLANVYTIHYIQCVAVVLKSMHW